MSNIKFIYDLPYDPNVPNGPTVKQKNLEKEHAIPIGTLVEVKYNKFLGAGACIKAYARLFVYDHIRDCDGLPLYILAGKHPSTIKEVLDSFENRNPTAMQIQFVAGVYEVGFTEEQFKVIEISNKIKHDRDVPEWSNEDE